MGDRGNIVVKQEGAPSTFIYLYSHWGGYGLPLVLRDALQRGRERWDDPSYLTRIIFCDMIEGNERDLTGFGIATHQPDNQHPLLVVDPGTGTVGVAKEGEPEKPHKTLTFAQYVELTDEQAEAFRGRR